MAYPESKDKTPVILVIHEIFGMTDWVQEVADEFAAAVYIAIAPDLLSGAGPGGKGTSSFPQGEATKAVSGLNADQITADLNAVADYALKLPSATQKLYVTGFCWGRRREFPICHEPSGSGSGICLLWSSTTERCDEPHQGASVRLLCRQRCADRRHRSGGER